MKKVTNKVSTKDSKNKQGTNKEKKQHKGGTNDAFYGCHSGCSTASTDQLESITKAN